MRAIERLIKNRKLITISLLIVVLAVAFVVFRFISSKDEYVTLEEEAVPLGYSAVQNGTLYISPQVRDYTEIIQSTFNEAVADGKVVEFENPNGNQVYEVSGTLVIPDGLEVIGNGATILYDFGPGKATFKAAGATAHHQEFAVITKGMLTKEITTFKIDGLNFKMRDNSAALEIPITLFGMGYCENVQITNCSFAVLSDVKAPHTVFDAYSSWRNVTIDGCTFTVMTDARAGGVWIRDFRGTTESENMNITNCKFNKRAGDEILAVWGSENGGIVGEVKNVSVRDCEFTVYRSESNNPVHIIRLGNVGNIDTLIFEGNQIHAEIVMNSVINLDGAKGGNDNIFIRDNTIHVEDILKMDNSIINGDGLERTAVFENNNVTVNTKSGLIKNAVSGHYTIVANNRFYGNGFNTVTVNVREVSNNVIEQCVNAFQGAVNCIDNIVEDCSGSFLILNGDNIRGKTGQYKTVTMRGNSLISKELAKVAVGSGDLYCNIVFEDNVVIRGRLALNNPSTSNILRDNIFYLSSLDNIVTSGTTKEFENNSFYDYNGDSLTASDSLIGSYNFNSSVPVGTEIYFDSSVSVGVETYSDSLKGENSTASTTSLPKETAAKNAASAKGKIIGYVKVLAGSGKNTWSPIYESDGGGAGN